MRDEFYSAADVNGVALAYYRSRAAYHRALVSEVGRLHLELEDAPFPVIAAVNGFCFAAGLEVALACDFIVAADDTTFAQVEALIGVTTLLGGVYRLAERCGRASPVARRVAVRASNDPNSRIALPA